MKGSNTLVTYELLKKADQSLLQTVNVLIANTYMLALCYLPAPGMDKLYVLFHKKYRLTEWKKQSQIPAVAQGISFK